MNVFRHVDIHVYVHVGMWVCMYVVVYQVNGIYKASHSEFLSLAVFTKERIMFRKTFRIAIQNVIGIVI